MTFTQNTLVVLIAMCQQSEVYEVVRYTTCATFEQMRTLPRQ